MISKFVETLGLRDLDIIEIRIVTPGVVEHIVRRLEMMHEKEGLALVPYPKPGE